MQNFQVGQVMLVYLWKYWAECRKKKRGVLLYNKTNLNSFQLSVLPSLSVLLSFATSLFIFLVPFAIHKKQLHTKAWEDFFEKKCYKRPKKANRKKKHFLISLKKQFSTPLAVVYFRAILGVKAHKIDYNKQPFFRAKWHKRRANCFAY